MKKSKNDCGYVKVSKKKLRVALRTLSDNQIQKLKDAGLYYPRITELGLTVYKEPIVHIKPNELKSKLTKKEQKLFSKHFGVATCPLIDGVCCYYIWDCENVLEKMATGKDFFWD